MNNHLEANHKIQKIYSLSSMQEGMLFHSILDNESSSYYQQLYFTIQGEFSTQLFEESLNLIIKRHDILRTNFVHQKVTKPQQVVFKEKPIKLHYEDLSQLDENNKIAFIDNYIKKERKQSFDLLKGTLIKLTIFKLTEQKHRVIISNHHIILDGWSIANITTEVLKTYSLILENKPVILGKAEPFNTYINWLKQYDTVEALAFWNKYLNNYEQQSGLSKISGTKANKAYDQQEIYYNLDSNSTSALHKLAKEFHVTLNTVMQVIWGILLQKHNNINDSVFGSVVSGRPAEIKGVENMVGLFINTIPVRIKSEINETFLSLIRKIQKQAFETKNYEYSSLAQIQSATNLKESPFDNIMMFENYPIEKAFLSANEQQQFDICDIHLFVQSTYNLIINIIPDTKLVLKLTYNACTYSKDFLYNIIEQLNQIINQITDNPNILISEIELVTESEKLKILRNFNSTNTNYPKNKTLKDLFEEQASKTPENIAVVFGDQKITYNHINQKSNQLAHLLISKGVGTESIVAIILERSIEMIVSILAILKAGGTYLPIDPMYPTDRISFMLEDSFSKILLTKGSNYNIQLSNVNKRTLTIIDLDDEASYTTNISNPPTVSTPENLAYIIYTSGTTGKPKGAMIENRNVVSLIFNDKLQFEFNSNDIWTMYHSMSFDFSVWEMYGALLYGGKLVIVPKLIAQEPKQFLELLKKEKVTILNQTPTAFFNVISEEIMCREKDLNLRYVIFGGEALKPSMLSSWKKKYQDIKLINMYGITETTVHVTYKEITEAEIEANISNIGVPIPTLSAYIMDKNLKLLPIGVAGELCVGGYGVCRGYLNRPELTKDKFVLNPYLPGERLYKSGDLARFLPNGEMEYLGRMDYQVKIRGHRIELGEIENKLLNIKAIKEAVVLEKTDTTGDKHLYAYIVDNSQITVQNIREALSRDLPEYMIPSYFIKLESMPLTSNGKINKKILLETNGSSIAAGVEYVAPKNETEEILVEAWQNVLNIEKIGVNDNFFNIGGDSINAISLLSRINNLLGTQLQMKDIYTYQTISKLAISLEFLESTQLQEDLEVGLKLIEDIKKNILDDKDQLAFLPISWVDFYPLSQIQSGMVFYSKLKPDEPIYHDQFIFKIKFRAFDIEIYRKALKILMDRHEILRTVFDTEHFNLAMQVVLKDILPNVLLEDLSEETKENQEYRIRAYLTEDINNKFIFDNEFLWRQRLFQVSENDFFIILSFQHAILDGWSVSVFNKEFIKIFSTLINGEEYEVQQAHSSYKDYVAISLAKQKSEKSKKFWKDLLKDYPRNKLPFNFTGKKINDSSGSKIYRKHLGKEILEKLKVLSNKCNCSIRDICLSAHIYLLKLISIEKDIVTGMVTHDRPVLKDAEKILGCFLNTIPVRLKLEGVINKLELLNSVKSYLKNVKEHELFLSDIASINGNNGSTANPIFDTLFNFTNFHSLDDIAIEESLKESDYNLTIESNEMTNTLFDLEVSTTMKTFNIQIKYAPSYFYQEDIEMAMKLYIRILEKFVQNDAAVLNVEELLTEQEKNQLIFEFNDTISNYPKEKTLHQLFEEQVERTPENQALILDGMSMTYRELNEKSNCLARLLINRQVKSGDNVGLIMFRSFDMIIGMLGILKAGAAYVPIDPDYPKARRAYIAENSKVTAMLVYKGFIQDNQKEEINNLIEIDYDLMKQYSTDNLNIEKDSTDLSYIIYTSGSTGMPKGVMIEHHMAVNLICWVNEKYQVTEKDTLLFITSMCFDLSVYDIFGMLATGGKIVIAKKEQIQSPKELISLLIKQQVTFWDSVPSTMNYMINSLDELGKAYIHENLRLVFMSGDWIPVKLPERLKKYFPNAKIISLGGATEGTIWSIYYQIENISDHQTSIPYGRPLNNNFFYILDEDMNILPRGVAGELYIGGIGVAKGYVNNEEKTNSSFVKDCFKTLEAHPTSQAWMMYKTGDLGRMLPDMTIEFLGRKDHQVKIRGYRVELGEIEHQLQSHKLINDAVVTDKVDADGNKYLCSYIVANKQIAEQEVTIKELREYLSTRLPDYMIPAYFIYLDKLPLTSNGKLDRKSLPEPDGNIETGSEYIAPSNELEEKLAMLWKEILIVDKVGINDNFFELGGNSLLLIKMHSRLEKENLDATIKITDIFNNPTISKLSEFLNTKKIKETVELPTKTSAINEDLHNSDIAIIGISVKMPMANGVDEFWENLENGLDCVTAFPDSRKQDIDKYRSYIGISNDESYANGSYLEDIDKFDYKYFRISPKEASLMNPNQRLFLQTAWEAIEDAGYGGEKIKGTYTGVYVGHSEDTIYDYKKMIYESEPESVTMALTGNITSVIAGRIAYLLDLSGPSMAIDTACSSSLVATHIACQGLRNGDCDMALTGGIKINLLPLEQKQKFGIESSDSITHTFDENSDGTGMGEGVACILLKPLKQAVEDNDNIYAVIKGSAINQDGNSIGLTAPNAIAQEKVIIRAWKNANIDPETVSYIEAHGTGTPLGDPIEIDGITRAFEKYTSKKQFCAIGSLKTNIGHLDNVAGIAGLIKVVLALRNKMIPPSIHFNLPNSKIAFVDSPIYISKKLSKWKTNKSPRRAGISAFGFSGTNCHLILEEYNENNTSKDIHTKDDLYIFTLSAKSKEALNQMIQRYKTYLKKEVKADIENICYTANTGRGHYQYRLAIIVNDIKHLYHKLLELNSIEDNIGIAQNTSVIKEANEKAAGLIPKLTSWNVSNESIITDIAHCYIIGADINWDYLYRNQSIKKVSLPTYAFESNRCWLKFPEPMKSNKSHLPHIQATKTVLLPASIETRLIGRADGNYSKTEKLISKVWGEVLGFEEINIKDIFFELGGDSISAMKIRNIINEQINIKLEVAEILRNNTIEMLAEYINEIHLIINNNENACPMEPVAKKDFYALSSAQKRLFTLSQFEGIGTSYNIPNVLVMEGMLDKKRMEQAFSKLIEKHEALRTSFELIDSEPAQKIFDKVEFNLSCTVINDNEIDEKVKDFINPFDLSNAPLFRAGLLELQEDKHILIVDMHHIISDGTSLGILVKDIMEIYLNGETHKLTLQYKDFAEWQVKQKNTEYMKKQESYWLNQFSSEIPVLNLPTDYPRPTMQSFEGDSLELTLNKLLTDKLKKLALASNTTIYITLFAVYSILLSKYSNQEDIVIGTNMSGRTSRELEKIIGMFVNTLPIRSYPEGHKSFKDFVGEIKESAFNAYSNQEFQFEGLMENLNLPRDLSRNPIFDTLFVMQNIEIPKINIQSLNIKPYNHKDKASRFDIELQAIEDNDQISFIFGYCTKLFKKETIEKLSTRFVSIINAVIQNPDIMLKDIIIIDEKEKHQLLFDFNNTEADYLKDKTLHELFEEQVERTPNNIAVLFQKNTLTYKELNQKANQLARILRNKGVQPNSIVALLVERSFEMVISIMAILKAGGAYLPIDPKYPIDRINFMLENSKAKVLLTQTSFDNLQSINESSKNITILNLDDESSYYIDSSNLDIVNTSTDLAYIIYTSGSTGNPKGVMIEHHSVINRIKWMQKKYPITHSDVILQKTTYTFDVSVWELLWWSLEGAKVCMLTVGGEKDPEEIIRAIESNKVTVMHFVPSMLNVFLEYLKETDISRLSGLRTVFSSGEALTPYQVEKFNNKLNKVNGTALSNLYGPTEATVDVTYFDCPATLRLDNVPIGKPIDNTRLYILDKYNKPQPIGVAGELCIAGVGLARGYLNNPELTAEKFILNPYVEQLIYRTGDLARWLPDGNIEYLGRLDYQVKIRGFRIELGEIESKLTNHKDIKEAVVLAKKDTKNTSYLCAYYVVTPSTGVDLTIADLRGYLSKELPDYMIPSYFIQLQNIPLTLNGKIDRKTLTDNSKYPESDNSITTGLEYEAPRNLIEQKLTELWEEILGANKISINDSFFQLGGHSLKATTLAGKVHKELNVDMPLKEIFNKPTIKEMAAYIKDTETSIYTYIQPLEASEYCTNYYATSSAQKRLYLLQQLDKESTAYNMTGALEIIGQLDIQKLNNAFINLIQRHESLRTSFEQVEDKILQKIQGVSLSPIEDPFKLVDLTSLLPNQIDNIIESFIKPFDLTKNPLLRVGLIKLEYEKYILIYDMHHIISDGISMNILTKELVDLYQGKELTKLRIQYKDYAVWQNAPENIKSLKIQEKYWEDILKTDLPILNMPMDYERKKVQSFNGSTIYFELNNKLVQKVQELAKKLNTTVNTLLISFYSMLIGTYSGQTDIIIGSTVANRNHADLQNIIGVFINFIPLKIKLEKENSILEFIQLNKKLIEDAYSNQEYPFDKMVEKFAQRTESNRNPIFDTMLIYHNEYDANSGITVDGLMITNYAIKRYASTLDFKLDISLGENNNLNCYFEYNTDLFKDETMKILTKQYELIIQKAVNDTTVKITELDVFKSDELLATAQKRKVLTQDKDSMQICIAATFTAEPMEEYLSWWCEKYDQAVNITFAPYNQVFQELLNPQSLLNSNSGINIIMIRFEDWLRDINANDKDQCSLLESNYIKLINAINSVNKNATYIAGLFPISDCLGLSSKVIEYIEKLYIRLKEALLDFNNISILDFSDGKVLYNVTEVFDLTTDKAGHMPFTEEYYAVIGTMISRKLISIRFNPFKVIAVDCDNTLWQGICGEDGALGVKIEPPFIELQKFLIRKHNEGMLIVLCSKNNEADLWAVFENNQQMLLNKQHLAGWKINWKSKSENIRQLANELNLGIDSFIFIDDSAVECYEMMQNNPQVLTLQLPEDSQQIPMYLKHIWAFDKENITEEDKVRTASYQAEKQRKQMQISTLTLEDFIKELNPKVYINEIQRNDVPRVSQLTQRTNQFNLNTIRKTEKEIEALINTPKAMCWTIAVEDKFGDYGLTGVVIMRNEAETLYLDTFLLSCRVLGRGIEIAILTELGSYCKKRGLTKIVADFYPTQKNQPFKDFLENSNWISAYASKDYISYEINIEAIPSSIDFVEIHYGNNHNFIKKSSGLENQMTKGNIGEFTKVEYETSMEANWYVALENQDKLVHKKYLLPIMYNTSQKLLRQLINESKNNNIISGNYQGATNQIEEVLIKLWEDVLKTEGIGINDNFFNLGGHSLKATNLIAKIHKFLNVEFPLREIFTRPTVKEIAEYIKGTRESMYSSIQTAEESLTYLASSAQKRIYTLQQFELQNISYNMPVVLEIEGKLNIEKLNKTFQKLIQRHESLRTSFELSEERLIQIVHKEVPFELQILDSTQFPAEAINQFIRVFDLSYAPLLRVGLQKNSSDSYILIFDIHHIISDGLSIAILVNEFSRIYGDEDLPELRIQYKDYSNWQNSLLKNGKLTNQEAYWINKLSGELPILSLPMDYNRPSMQSFDGNVISFIIDKELTQKLREITKETNTTMYMLLLTIYKILLSKYSGQEDIIVGSPIAGRPHADLQNIIGMFVNTLAIRSFPEGNKTFRQFLMEVKETALQAYENQDYQFEELVEKLDISRDMSRNPLFDVMFVLQNTDIGDVSLEGLKIKPYQTENKISKFDITLTAVEQAENILIDIEYCTKLFKKETIERLCLHLIHIMQGITSNIDIILGNLHILPELERQQILIEFNRTETEYIKNKTINQLFEEQVQKSPNNIAVVYKQHSLTYTDLNQRSNQLARQLRKNGVKSNSIVALAVDRSFTMLIGIMAVLKAGGAYLPIDPKYPYDRISYMLKDSGAEILLTQDSIDKFENIKVLNLNIASSYDGDSSNLNIINNPKDLAYVIYTSGSTGNPKGVMIEHHSVINRIKWMQKKYPINHNDVILQKTTYTFDVSVWELLWWSLEGAKVCMLISGGEKDPEAIVNAIEYNKATVMHFVPSMLSVFLEYLDTGTDLHRLSSLKQVFASGEALTPNQVEKFNTILHKANSTTLSNLYGPTEATVDVTYYDCPTVGKIEKIPIGRPIHNIKLYILEKHNQPCPIGVVGELCIAGVGLARGYINKPELTAEKFVSNPFVSGQTMYRTGDLAKWLPDGNIEYLGRLDYQVKIRGFRIELGEIESKLASIEYIKEAAVIAKEDNAGNKYLCAYVVANELYDIEKGLATLELKDKLSKELPDYMIPSYFIQIDKLPITSNGKLDRKVLTHNSNYLELTGGLATKLEYQAPRNTTESKLIKLWKEIFEVDSIGINDNFFALGGHSLKVVSLVSKIHKELNIHIPLKVIFDRPTIKGIGEYIAKENFNTSINESGIYLLNNQKPNNIFAFPPVLGYGLAYLELAKQINSHSLYALDFIEADNRIDEYVKLITSTQYKEPFILLGYSAGGSLAYDVATRLISNGYEVSNLIIFDSILNNKNYQNDEMTLKEKLDICMKDTNKQMEANEVFKQYLGVDYIYENLKRRCEKYLIYLETFNCNQQKLKTDVHLILPNIENEQAANELKINPWKNSISGNLSIYNGAGEHHQMITGSYLIGNVKTVKEILKNIQ